MPMAPRHLLGNDLVREARRRAGLTQRELAERAGTTQSAIARLEGGHTSPSFETVLSLVRACGLNLSMRIVDQDDSATEQAMRNLLLDHDARLRQLHDTVRFVEAGRAAVREARGA